MSSEVVDRSILLASFPRIERKIYLQDCTVTIIHLGDSITASFDTAEVFYFHAVKIVG